MFTKKYQDLEIGSLIKAGTSKGFKTGSWKSFRPVWMKEKCISCMMCVINCPEDCIPSKDGKRSETDLDMCKGCGICAEVCPVKCIKMVVDKEE